MTDPRTYDRLARLARLPAEATGDESGLDLLAAACAELTGAAGAGIVVQLAGQPPAAWGAAPAWATGLEEAQFAHGDGPGPEAVSAASPVVADLAAVASRWPELAPVLSDSGIRAVSALPLRAGGETIGALTLYGDRERVGDPDELPRMTEVAAALTEVLLATVAGVDDELAWLLEEGAIRQAVVHQATGMIAAELGCSVEEALVRLRAQAFAADDSVVAVARRILARQLTCER